MIKMKKSNYVLILFVVIIWGGNALLKKSISNPPPMVKYSKKLDPFSVVVAQPGSKVFLQTQWNSTHYPTFSYTKGESDQHRSPSFGVRNDTLFVFSSSSDAEHRNDSFYCTAIKSIVGQEKSYIQLSYFKADTLNLKLRHTKLNGDFDHGTKKSRMLTLEADSSAIEFKSLVRFDQFIVRLNRSHLKILMARFDTSFISGTMQNYSRLVTGGQVRLKIKKDETSYSNF
jgi:hypothetical protein